MVFLLLFSTIIYLRFPVLTVIRLKLGGTRKVSPKSVVSSSSSISSKLSCNQNGKENSIATEHIYKLSIVVNLCFKVGFLSASY